MLRHLAAPVAALLAVVLVTPAAAAPFPSRIDLPPGFMPEGIASGPGPVLYVGSLAGGAVWVGNAVTGAEDILVDPAPGAVAVGLEYEAGADRLWVAGGPTGAVRVYDASSGALLATYTFSPTVFLNDLVVTDDAVYVTDSGNAWLNVIPLGTGGALPDPSDVTRLPFDGIDVVTGQFNLNGIEEVRGWLIAVQSNMGLLYRIDPATGDATAIDTGGYSVAAGDGLYAHGNTLYVVRNQVETVSAFKLSADVTEATLLGEIRDVDATDVPTTATVAAGRLWVVNARFGTQDPQPAPYWINRLPTRP